MYIARDLIHGDTDRQPNYRVIRCHSSLTVCMIAPVPIYLHCQSVVGGYDPQLIQEIRAYCIPGKVLLNKP